MNRIIKHMEKIGLVPHEMFTQSEHSIAYSDGENGYISVKRWSGKTYKAERVKVYTNNAIMKTRFESTRMDEINDWIDVQIGIFDDRYIVTGKQIGRAHV